MHLGQIGGYETTSLLSEARWSPAGVSAASSRESGRGASAGAELFRSDAAVVFLKKSMVRGSGLHSLCGQRASSDS
jgi:hypothetical protein